MGEPDTFAAVVTAKTFPWFLILLFFDNPLESGT
jgi:hypothetical protein